jgi:two-component system cell cycle sensor histidine kinase/response regulator CckA
MERQEACIRTVLVVDDEAPILEIVARMLRYGGHDVLEATSGVRGAEIAASHPGTVHLLVTDVTMPGVSGPELARRLMESDDDLKVLFISGDPRESFADPDRRTLFLQKPFSSAVLLAKVAELLARPGRQQAVSPKRCTG